MHYFNPYYLIPGSRMEEMRNIPHPKEPMPTKYFSEEEAFIKGNLFIEEYVPYKNYVPTMPHVKGEGAHLLEQIQICRAVCHDLNLLLDVHPHDQKALVVFNEHNRKLHGLVHEYEKKYGALTPQSEVNGMHQDFSYVKTKSPWIGQ